jgi:hypothetical protein
VLQATQANEDVLTLDRLALRFSATDPGLAADLRKLQELADSQRQQARLASAETAAALDAAIRGDKKAGFAPTEATSHSVDLKNQIKELWQRLARDHPALSDAVRPPVLDIAEVQQRLGPQEALVLFYTDQLEAITWVVTKKKSQFFNADRLAKRSVVELIVTLRQALDLSDARSEADIRPFDAAAAYELYQVLLAAAHPALTGIKHLYVVPDAPLRSLPLSLLVSEPPPPGLSERPIFRRSARLRSRTTGHRATRSASRAPARAQSSRSAG